jgi:hypothetical protein
MRPASPVRRSAASNFRARAALQICASTRCVRRNCHLAQLRRASGAAAHRYRMYSCEYKTYETLVISFIAHSRIAAARCHNLKLQMSSLCEKRIPAARCTVPKLLYDRASRTICISSLVLMHDSGYLFDNRVRRSRLHCLNFGLCRDLTALLLEPTQVSHS